MGEFSSWKSLFGLRLVGSSPKRSKSFSITGSIFHNRSERPIHAFEAPQQLVAISSIDHSCEINMSAEVALHS